MGTHHTDGHHDDHVLVTARGIQRELLQALDDEIDATRRRRRLQSIPVEGGVRLPDSVGRPLYAFPRPTNGGGLRPGGDVGFEVNGSVVQAYVIEATRRRLVLAVEENLGPHTPPGRVIIDNLWLLVALRSRIAVLQRLAAAPGSTERFRFETALRSVGLGDLTIRESDCDDAAQWPGELNENQRRVVELIHCAPGLYLWGPPGTGKTVTLSHLVRLIARSKRILIVGPTNLAVDGLLELVVQAMHADGSWKDGAVVRLGPSDGITLDSTLRAEVSLDALVGRRMESYGWAHRHDGTLKRQHAVSVIEHCRVLATTVHQTYLSPLLMDSRWDVLVADEASMIQPAALYTAAGLARQYVIAGDFRQLSPVVLASTVPARAWLRRDPFDVIGVPEDVARGDHPDHLVMLQEQYRMAPDICGLVSEAYAGLLVTHESARIRPPGPLGGKSVQFIDSSTLESRVEIDRNGSRSKPVHVALISDLLHSMLERQSIDRAQLRKILVITPFVLQARLLDEALRQRFGRHRPHVRTVHRCQGREADFVIFDLVDAANERVSKFLAGNDLASDGGRLQTVAVTRARDQLLVIADIEYLLHARAAGAVTRRLLQRVEEVGHATTSVPLRHQRRAA